MSCFTFDDVDVALPRRFAVKSDFYFCRLNQCQLMQLGVKAYYVISKRYQVRLPPRTLVYPMLVSENVFLYFQPDIQTRQLEFTLYLLFHINFGSVLIFLTKDRCSPDSKKHSHIVACKL